MKQFKLGSNQKITFYLNKFILKQKHIDYLNKINNRSEFLNISIKEKIDRDLENK